MASVESKDVLGGKVFGIRSFGQFTGEFAIGSKNLKRAVICDELCTVRDCFPDQFGIADAEFLAVRR